MGGMYNLACNACGLEGRELPFDGGMSPLWDFLEQRLFYCAVCRAFASRAVLRRVDDLRARFPQAVDLPWSASTQADTRLSFTRSQLASLLLDVASPPRCDCGARLRGSTSFRESVTGCPSCGGELRVDCVGFWD